MTQPSARLREQFGNIDVYLFDQLLRGRFVEGMKVLDAGCGEGRNLVFLMRARFDLWGVDENPDSIARVQRLAAELAPQQPKTGERLQRHGGHRQVPHLCEREARPRRQPQRRQREGEQPRRRTQQ